MWRGSTEVHSEFDRTGEEVASPYGATNTQEDDEANLI